MWISKKSYIEMVNMLDRSLELNKRIDVIEAQVQSQMISTEVIIGKIADGVQAALDQISLASQVEKATHRHIGRKERCQMNNA